MMKKNGLLVLLVIMLMLSACTKKDGDEDLEDELVIPDAKETEDIEEPAPQFAAPFTGILQDEENTFRPVVVTINNHPMARPQSGIDKADMIYEMVAEGNVTRWLAVYQSELPDEIGPVRSAREYFIELAKGLDAFYIAHGYSPEAKRMLMSGYVDNINGMQHDGTLFKRSAERKAPHNSYISGEQIEKAIYMTDASAELRKNPAFSFYDSVEDATLGEASSSFTVRYGNNSDFTSNYHYLASKGTYTREVKDTVTIDKTTGQPIDIANILVFEVDHRTIDAEGRQELNLTSGGKGLLFQAGKVKEIEWRNEEGILQPMDSGVSAKLVPGKTWIHLVPSHPGMSNVVTYTP